MVITVYISGISGNKEVKKRQQRVMMILESRGVEFEPIDIAEPGRQAERDRLKQCGAVLPPQLFNGEEYCGDYDQFDLANEIDEIEKFLKLPIGTTNVSSAEVTLGNGITKGAGDADNERISPEKIEEPVKKEEEPTSPDNADTPTKEENTEVNNEQNTDDGVAVDEEGDLEEEEEDEKDADEE